MVLSLNTNTVTPILYQIQISLLVMKNLVTLAFRGFSFQDRRIPTRSEIRE